VGLVWPLVLVVFPVLYWLYPSGDALSPGMESRRTGGEAALAVGAPEDQTGIEAAESVITEPSLAFESTELGRGRTLTQALSELGLSTETRLDVLDAVQPILDLRRLRPETGIVAARNDEGRIERITIRAQPEQFVRVDLAASDGEIQGEVVELPLRTSIETAGGRVATSVSQALADCPRGVQLTLAFADIFQWDVDLLVDPRPGDQVSVVYEVSRLGDVPRDLPPFGDAPREAGQFLGLGRIVAARYDGSVARSSAFWVAKPDGDGSYYDDDGNALQKTFLKSPLNYRRISSRFSRARLNPVTRRVVPHHGVDFAAATGTPVVAAADGRVVASGWSGPLGRAVRIRHGSEYETVYGHLSGVARGLGVGDSVRQNQLIGYVGSTGRATGPHLHFTMLQRGQPIDPLRFRNPPTEPLAPELQPTLDRAKSSWTPLLESILSSVDLAATGTEGRRPGA
jgi:murein DD-endopeptidase MepM/ murein hydrolase activator NlpD